MLNARQSDGSLPETTLLHLASTSGLIDKGTNVGLTFSGSAPDLGAYEYSPLNAVSNTTSTDSGISVFYTAVNHRIEVHGNVNSVEVYGLSGIKVYTQPVSSGKLLIQTSDWKNGIYLVRTISIEGFSSTKKLLVD
jgi:hypothetical protein